MLIRSIKLPKNQSAGRWERNASDNRPPKTAEEKRAEQ